jgi:biopolymer transport protein ExbB/TolQ
MRRSIAKQPGLNWSRGDIEQRLFLAGGRFTQVNTFLAGAVALVLTVLVYIVLGSTWLADTAIGKILRERSWTQHACVFLTLWSLTILFVKWLKLRLQRRALDVKLFPAEPGFVISASTVDEVLRQMQESVDDSRRFLLLNRIEIALANLRNLGRVGDVDEILRSQAAQDESQLETSYAVVQGFVWAIPVLGFIGTVLGLSQAIGSFSGVIDSGDGVASLTAELKKVTVGLTTAFDTTLVALIAALIIQLLVVLLKKAEQEFLDDATEHCIRYIVGRLRIEPGSSDG